MKKQLLISAFRPLLRNVRRMRWWMHQLIFWGCLLAVAITFPLVFGWVHFRSAPEDQMTYITYLFGFPVGSFRIRTILSWLIFHGLDIAAVMVLAGVFLALWRRMRDQGAQAVQSFAIDFFPLILLTAISVTGLALTASTLWLRGNFYDFLSILHAITVVAGLLYLPFGKFFHIFQRPAQLGVKLYQNEGESDPGTQCSRCGERFASRMHIQDLNGVLRELGFDYATLDPGNVAGSVSGVQKEIPGNHTIAIEEGVPWHGRRLMRQDSLNVSGRIRNMSRLVAGRARRRILLKN